MSTAHEHAPAGTATFVRDGVSAVAAGQQAPPGVRVGVAVARFNASITEPLFHGAVDVLRAAGVAEGRISAVQVPGAVELPLAARQLVAAGCEAVVVLGCVIRGETSHFDYVCSAATDGVLRVMLDERVPVGFGLITCEDVDQALRRSESGEGGHNVGADAARAAIEMLALARTLQG
jgi:6,7-dimethyl-8-ribityllumazine synthase